MADDPVGRSIGSPGVDLAVVVLAAGEGRRLRPLSQLVPKPLCPVLDRTLLDRSLDRIDRLDPLRSLDVVANIHHGGAAIAGHLERCGVMTGWIDGDGKIRRDIDPSVVADLPRPPLERRGSAGGQPPRRSTDSAADAPGGTGNPVARRPVLVSPEADVALGTAGAVGRLVPWLDGRGVLVLNGDTFTTVDPAPLLEGWDGRSHRVLVAGEEPFGPGAHVAGALVPWSAASGLVAEPSGLWERCWRDAHAAGAVDWVNGLGAFVDCGTPARYLEANLLALELAMSVEGDLEAAATGSAALSVWRGPGSEVRGIATRSVVGAGAVVDGEVVDSVVWPGGVVHPGERLRSTIRTTVTATGQALTVVVR